MNNPLISIFLPTAARYESGLLRRAIESALNQTLTRFELLVVDDGSTDGTQQYLESISASDPRVKVVRLPKNTGLPAYALSKTFRKAKGQYFTWLFDDCEFFPTHLERLSSFLDTHADIGMVYAQAQANIADDTNQLIGSPFDLNQLLSGANHIPNVACMVRRTVIEKVGWYDPHVLLKRVCDWDLWVRIGQTEKIAFIPEPQAIENGRGRSDSLGRLNSLNMPLVLRYSATSRNARLAPASLEMADAFRRDLGIELSRSEQVSLETLFLEHALLTKCHPEAVKSAKFLHAIKKGQSTTPSQNGNALFDEVSTLFKNRMGANAAVAIELDAAYLSALQVSDQRGIEISQLTDRLATTTRSVEEIHASSNNKISSLASSLSDALSAHKEALRIADSRYDLILELQGQLSDQTALASERARALETDYQAALAIADARYDMILRLQEELAASQGAHREATRIADARYDMILQLQEGLAASQDAHREATLIADARYDMILQLQQELIAAQDGYREAIRVADEKQSRAVSAHMEALQVADNRYELILELQDRLSTLSAELNEKARLAEMNHATALAIADARYEMILQLQKDLTDAKRSGQ
ncbi:MAG: glycosyltransferase family 2 protein [Proteobacteria bacterium]|nr:glycosyltransferase family 2 protein [Pseudomonadota bacterium]